MISNAITVAMRLPRQPTGKGCAVPTQLARYQADPALSAHIGVGGLSLSASRALPADHSGSRAQAALGSWSHVLREDRAGPGHPGDFPFADILPHYQAVGRLQVAPDLVAGLREVRALLPRASPRPGAPGWLLTSWLPSATDQEDGDYESFLGRELLDQAVAVIGPDVDTAADTLIAALVADLVRYESAVAALAQPQRPQPQRPPPDRRQRGRLIACAHAMARTRQFAPRALADRPGLAGMREALSAALPDAELAELALDGAASVLAAVPAPLRQVATVTMLPITPLHDEYMFLRCVQIFETLYWQVVRCLDRGLAALLDDDLSRTHAELSDAAARLEATPALYRVLTTMPREVFAVIRGLTDGRSAIQSRPYRLVEMMTAPRELSAAVRGKVPPLEFSGPTLQEVFEQKALRLGAGPLLSVIEAMTRLDVAWRAMKRTHWGITLKIIGEVTGTGGTTGVFYLETAARVPLFPLLHEVGRDE
jgi:tryptophan 2,3-dioxygenase